MCISFFFFKQKTAYEMRISDWSSDVCSSDLKVRFTGKKLTQKIYYRHTGYAGGIKEARADKVLAGKFPERVLEKAVERMVPRGPLGRQQMRNLRIFAGTDHPHAAQNPEVLDVAAMNRSAERRVGKECVSPCRSRWWPYH